VERSAPYSAGGPPDAQAEVNADLLGGDAVELNQDGLPMRPDREACLYYLNTGTCRSGPQCIFHHPPREQREAELNKSLSKAGMLPPGGVSEDMPPMSDMSPPIQASTDGPVVVPPPLGGPIGVNSQMDGIMAKLEALGESDGTPAPADGQATPLEKGGEDKKEPERKQWEPPKEVEWNEDGLAMRPGVQKCGHYLRTGRCTSSCRLDHPSGMGGIMNSSTFASMPGMIGGLMTEGALAMRPGKDQCPFLSRTGTCPFGPECRFDHSGSNKESTPSNPESLSKPAVPPVSKKKDKGLGGTRARRPPPRGY
jgi:hypothetical protein